MSSVRIDVSDLSDASGDGSGAPKTRRVVRPNGEAQGSTRGRPVLLRLLRMAVFAALLAVAPFLVLVRGGVFAYQRWDLGAWPSLGLAALATVLLVSLYGLVAGARLGAGRKSRKMILRGVVLLVAAYVVYSLVLVAGANFKTPEVRAEYVRLHPLLRVAASTVMLFDSDAVVTDASRTPEFYARLGLPPNESSLHFVQATGFVHALDLRTLGRPEWRNTLSELVFKAMGFRTLRHAGTADHLHVSLPDR